MKKCPKCGADNRPDNDACYLCFATLDGVPSTSTPATPGPLTGEPLNGPTNAQPMQPGQPAPPVQPVGPAHLGNGGGYTPQTNGPLVGGPLNGGPLTGPAQGEEQQTVVGQPLGGYQQQQRPSPYGPPPGSYGPPPSSYGPRPYPGRGEHARPEPVKRSDAGTWIAVILLIVAVLGGGGFCYWKYVIEPNTPINIVRKYMAAAEKNDPEQLKKYICKSNLDLPGVEQALSGKLSFWKYNSGNNEYKEGKQFILIAGPIEDTTATVYVKPGPESKSKPLPASLEKGVPLILVKEEGKWKIDLVQTIQKLMVPIMQEMQRQGGGNPFGGYGR